MELTKRLDNYQRQCSITDYCELDDSRLTSKQRRRLKHKRLHDVARNLRGVEKFFKDKE